ncbi:MAG: hypothetical protein IKN58_10810 [Prevotella sp.]|nr:hypothetical protein [Prevotella sp.]
MGRPDPRSVKYCFYFQGSYFVIYLRRIAPDSEIRTGLLVVERVDMPKRSFKRWLSTSLHSYYE